MSISRAHFRELQILRYTDFEDEQAYRIAQRRRHNLAHHGWGIVQGLVLQPSLSGVSLSAGFAIDGYGRELTVSRRLEIRQSVLDEVLNALAVGNVDVWLTYHIVASDNPQEPCYEDAWLRLDCADPNRLTEPRHPAEVSLLDLDFGPERQPPDDPGQEWPVYLGRIAVGAGDISLPPHSRNLIDLSERVYASLVGASVQTPAGYPWLQLGDEEAADHRRFAISLPDAQGKPVDRWSIGRDGDSVLRGRMRLAPAYTSPLDGDGDLALMGTAPALSSGGGIQWDALANTPETARAWQLYRTAVEIEQGQQTFQVDQLRMESFHPGEEGDPTRASWVVGELDGQTAHILVPTEDPGQHMVVTALAAGAWGNRVFLRVIRVSATSFQLALVYYKHMPPMPLIDPTDPANAAHPNRREPDRFEVFDDLQIDTQAGRYCLTTVNTCSELVRLTWADPFGATSLPVDAAFSPLVSGEDGTFESLMTVRSDGTVIVNCDLHVEGQLMEGAIPADVEDERFRDELLGRWTKGLTLAGTEVDAYYEQPLQVSLAVTANNGVVEYDVTITHTIGGENRGVPIVSVLSEFRNDDRLLIHTENLDLEQPRPEDLNGDPNPNPLLPGDDMLLRSTVTLGEVGAITLTVRVFSLGVAQNTVEKSATTVIDLNPD